MLSDKQLAYLQSEDPRITLLYGSVSSGKTYVSLLKYSLMVGSYPENTLHLMTGKTITSLKRNCLILLQELVGTNNFTFSISQKTGRLFGRTVFFEGANDERAESKIRGLTLATAYVDELTLIPEEFYKMLLSRLREYNAKLLATTNPGSPVCYVKKDIIDNDKIDKKSIKFVIDDNTFLDPEYVKQIKAEYTGVFYERFIEGKFTLAEGLIYPNYQQAIVPTVDRYYTEYQISIDYGIQNPFAMGLYGLSSGVWYKVKEYHHSGRETQQQKTDGEYYEDLEKFAGGLRIQKVIIDPSATSFITLIRRKGRFAVVPADNDVLDGIRETASALKQGFVKINDCCEESINEFKIYAWDDKGEDVPIKESDHHCDELRYFVKTNRIAVPKRKSLV